MSSMGSRGTSNALRNLWESAADNLTPEQLEWFNGLTEFAKMEAENISVTLDTLAALHAHDNNGWLSDSAVTNVLCSTSYQVATIAALLEVAGGAADRLKHPDHYEKIRETRSKSND